jgi:hypothetical protein
LYQPLTLGRFDDEFSSRARPEDWQILKDLRDHPRYLDGVVAYDDAIPTIFANNIALNRLVTQVERMQMIAFTLHLFDTFDPADPSTGLTVSRLQQLCTVHNLASNGGVVAFVALMTVMGYLDRQRSAEDRRVVHYAPTPKFMVLVDRWTKAILHSIDVIEPEAQLVASYDAHPRFGWDTREASVQALLGGWQPLAPFPETAHFVDAHGGWMLLCHTVAILLREGGRREIVPVSVDLAAFGKNFGVSRSHLRRLLEGAYEQGLLDAPPRNGKHVVLSPRLLAACLSAQAGELATHRHSAHWARERLRSAAAA